MYRQVSRRSRACRRSLQSWSRRLSHATPPSFLGEEEFDELKDFLAANPEAGVVIPASGGVRKLRWAASGRGKRGGARVIYYYHGLDIPLFLISIFAKNQKSDLDAAELKAAREFAEAIAKAARQRKD